MYAGFGCLFLLFISILLIGVGLLKSIFQILGAVFGFNRLSGQQSQRQQQTQRPSKTEAPRQQEKIFKKEEGKYVDFEEV